MSPVHILQVSADLSLYPLSKPKLLTLPASAPAPGGSSEGQGEGARVGPSSDWVWDNSGQLRPYLVPPTTICAGQELAHLSVLYGSLLLLTV